MLYAIWYHLYNFKKLEKHPCRSVNLSKVAGFNLTKNNTLPRKFFTFLNCANGTKSCKVSHITLEMYNMNKNLFLF